MVPGDGWYVLGPVIAVAVVGLLGAFLWWLGLAWAAVGDTGDPLHELYPDGLAILGEPEDYGLLYPAAVTDEAEVAEEIRHLLRGAGIRATEAISRDGRVAVLVFADELDEARRLVDDTPAL